MAKLQLPPVIPVELRALYAVSINTAQLPGGAGYQTRIGKPGAPRLSSALDNRYRSGGPRPGRAYRDATASPNDWYSDFTAVTGGYVAPDPKNPAAPRRRTYTPRGQSVPADLDKPGTTIRDSAMDAATWLSLVWPMDAVAAGIDIFIANRYEEIQADIWPPRYWAKATKRGEFAEVTIPTSTHDPNQGPPEYYDPTMQRSATSYGPAGTPYALPTPGSGLPTPSPGYNGSVSSNHYRDNYLATLLEDFDLPRPYYLHERPPIFASCEATWIVQTNKRPTQIQFSTRHRPVFQTEDDPLINDPEPIDKVGRFLNWTYPLPTGGTINYNQAMTRRYRVDCNIGAAYASNNLGRCERFRLKQTCAAARGRYHADSANVSVQFFAQSDIYMALRPAPDYIPPLLYAAVASRWLSTTFDGQLHEPTDVYIQNYRRKAGGESWPNLLEKMTLRGEQTGRLATATPYYLADETWGYINPFINGEVGEHPYPDYTIIGQGPSKGAVDYYTASIFSLGGPLRAWSFPGFMTQAMFNALYVEPPHNYEP